MKLALPILLALGTLTAYAQRLTIVLDPARGGSEYGTRIDGRTYEKQVTLDLANRLRALLKARDFNVVLTREADTLVTNDARATVANQNKAIACLLLHTTASGTGLHLFTSSHIATPPATTAVLWNEAQAPFVQRSQRLANEFTTAFSRSRIPVSSARTWVRPLDNMQCPAVAIEIAPESDGTRPNDRAYQNRIADAIAGALLFWRGHQDIVESIMGPPPQPKPQPESAPTPKSDPTAPSPKPPSAAGIPKPANDATQRPPKSTSTPANSTLNPPTSTPKPPVRKPLTPKPDPDGGIVE